MPRILLGLCLVLLLGITTTSIPHKKLNAQVYPAPVTVGTAANRPTWCSSTGQFYYATDTVTLYISTVAGTSCTWVQVGGAGGSGSWSGLTAPSGNLALSMGSDLSEFDTTSALANFFNWSNLTAAVVGTSQGSPVLDVCGQAFHASATALDCMTLSELPGNGNDAAITFTIGHSGTSTGAITLALAATTISGPASSNLTIKQAAGNNLTIGAASGLLIVGGSGNPTEFNMASGVMADYQGIATVDWGVPTIFGSLNQTGVSTANSGSPQTVYSVPGAGAGHYRLNYYIDESAGCTTVSTGSLTVVFGWTDATAARTSSTLTLTPGTADTGATSYLSGSIDLWSAASQNINVTTTYTACSSGTWTYDLHSNVERTK